MAYRHIDVTTLTPAVGAEIRGVDLREPLPDETFEEVRSAFLRHQVVFFKEQEALSPDRQSPSPGVSGASTCIRPRRIWKAVRKSS